MEDNDFAKRCSGNVSFPHMTAAPVARMPVKNRRL